MIKCTHYFLFIVFLYHLSAKLNKKIIFLSKKPLNHESVKCYLSGSEDTCCPCLIVLIKTQIFTVYNIITIILLFYNYYNNKITDLLL